MDMEEIEPSVSLRMWIGAAVVIVLVVAGILIFTHSKSAQDFQTPSTQNAVEIIPSTTPPAPTTLPTITPPIVHGGSATTTQPVYYYYPLSQEQGSQSQSLGSTASQSQTLGNLTQTQN